MLLQLLLLLLLAADIYFRNWTGPDIFSRMYWVFLKFTMWLAITYMHRYACINIRHLANGRRHSHHLWGWKYFVYIYVCVFLANTFNNELGIRLFFAQHLNSLLNSQFPQNIHIRVDLRGIVSNLPECVYEWVNAGILKRRIN